jgi:hypothetical protein
MALSGVYFPLESIGLIEGCREGGNGWTANCPNPSFPRKRESSFLLRAFAPLREIFWNFTQRRKGTKKEKIAGFPPSRE